MEAIETTFLVLAYVAVLGFLISGLDDLFFDTQFLVYLWRRRKQPHLSLPQLRLESEQWIALFVPAWLEGGVVNKMAEYAARVVMYEKYDIFIGVYPNDPETIRCVDEICARHPRIHKVVVPHDGPTSKADCLNWIYRAMRLNEIPGVREYRVIAIHDAEDVMHPLVLKLYNAFIPRTYDMGQVPVFALELPLAKYWVGNTYIDDFAELHTKDLFVREAIGGVVPSAGVGTAFARPALDRLAAENGGEPFFVGNLTEDYEVGIRMKRAGYRVGVISYPVDRIVRRPRRDGSPGEPETVTEVVAIREAFPKTFRMAVRQRSRWILGISFQTWEQAGWAGTWPMRYTLLRDRRAPLTHFINMLGYLLLGYLLFQWAFRHSPWGASFYLRPVFDSSSLLWKITILDTWLLAYRGVQKFISVQMIYNFRQAAASIPRVVLGNLVNFAATLRAAKMFFAHKLFGRPIVWLKTTHVFPGEAELREYTKSIEDLLVEEGLATREQIFEALKRERAGSAPLCLLRLGLLDEKQFTEVWSRHSGLPVQWIDPFQLPEALLRRFDERTAVELQAMPVEDPAGGGTVAFREPPTEQQLERMRQHLGRPVEACLARPSHLAFVRDRAYPRLVLPPSRLMANLERFRAAADVRPDFFLRTWSQHHPGRHSLPDVMVDTGMLSEPDARRLWAEALGCPPCDPARVALNQELYFKLGPVFWWLHRMIPVNSRTILTATAPHPRLTAWMAARLGTEPRFEAELPEPLEQTARRFNISVDPDQILLDVLAARGVLRAEDLPNLRALRALVTDPAPHWLRVQRLASEEQLHQAFVDISHLPPAAGWEAKEVTRLAPALPPGFAGEHGCGCLRAADGLVELGLTQLPSARVLREIHDRLAGHPLFFQALRWEDAGAIRQLAGPAPS